MQQDEFKPRQLEAFTGRNATCPEIVSAPSTLNVKLCAVLLSCQLFLKPHLQGAVSPTSCMTCLLSQYLGAHGKPLNGWHCGFLERMQVATHLATVSVLHMSACTPQMLSPGVFVCVQAACTQAASFCMHARELGGQSYLWGKVKVSGKGP